MSANPAEPIRIVFFGTPAYAVPALEALLAEPRVHLVLVVTQPDRPAGRGRTLTAPPVKDAALAAAIPTYQPETLRTAADRNRIDAAKADLFVVAAFGKIFGPKLLGLPRLGAVNLHASLLPLYRGASPISAAILDGQPRNRHHAHADGYRARYWCYSRSAEPPNRFRRHYRIADATAGTPRSRAADRELDSLIDGTLDPIAQRDQGSTLTRPLIKADGWIDWNDSAVEIERQIRAMWDWPRGWTTFDGEQVQIHRASVDSTLTDASPGTVLTREGNAVVTTGDGHLIIRVAQRAGSKPLSGSAWLQQSKSEGHVLGLKGAPDSPALPMIRPVQD